MDSRMPVSSPSSPDHESKRLHAALEGSPVDAIPAEVLAQVLSHLGDRERCDVIPLVNKHWLHVHKHFPPRRKVWSNGVHGPITLPMVRWFVRIAGGLEELDVWCAKDGIRCFLPQMLALAATSAPQLRRLKIGLLCSAQPVLHSLALLSQLRELSLYALRFSTGFNAVSGIPCLSALSALEVIDLHEVVLDGRTASHGDQLWKALSNLKKLHKLCFREYQGLFWLEGAFSAQRGVHANFFRNVSLVTNIRSLRLAVSCQCLVGGRTLHTAFSNLSQLTAFESRGHHSSSAASPILGLPQLRQLSVEMEKNPLQSRNFAVASEHLTCLEISGCRIYSAREVLGVSTALSSLRVLRLTATGLDTFPASVASRLCSLHELDLSENCFARPPPALRHIKSLTSLDLSQNEDLQLEQGDQATLEALTNLRLLRLGKDIHEEYESLWSAASLQVVFCIGQACRQLELRL